MRSSCNRDEWAHLVAAVAEVAEVAEDVLGTGAEGALTGVAVMEYAGEGRDALREK